MKFVDIIIMIVLVIAIALAVFFAVRRKRRGCCGCGKDDCPYKKSRKKRDCNSRIKTKKAYSVAFRRYRYTLKKTKKKNA